MRNQGRLLGGGCSRSTVWQRRCRTDFVCAKTRT